MRSSFDWLRLAFTGAELLATLRLIADEPAALRGEGLGAPLSALDGPCERCWTYARLPNDTHCAPCRAILDRRRTYAKLSRAVVLIWGYVNQTPRALRQLNLAVDQAVIADDGRASYIAGDKRFLQVLPRRDLQSWLHDLLLYDGGSVTGLLQIFPTTGVARGLCMNDLVCRVVNRETTLGLDQLRVRFYGAPHHVMIHYTLEQEGLLTFKAADFLGMLEMAVIFRQMLHPREQDMLRELLTTDDLNQEQFYWGRFLGMLRQEVRDMLHAWQVRQWSKEQVNLFYTLLRYVYVDFPWTTQ